MFGGRGKRMSMKRDPTGSMMVESRRTGKDPRNVGVCAACGSPHNLKTCSSCGKVRYCSRECQVSDWKAGHKQVCKAKVRAGGASSS